MSNSLAYRVEPGSKWRVGDCDPADTGGYRNDETSKKLLAQDLERLSELQEKLYADNRFAVLVVLQGMDASGKDGTIKHVMSGLNPIGVQVTSFKAPSEEELDHGFLWRIHRSVPRRGNIGIFNRSHYEDVVIARVNQLVPEKVWRGRYEQINHFEELLAASGFVVVKFFLHISKKEQKERFEERLRNPAKRWKFSAADLEVRKNWEAYMGAYEDAVTRCSTKHAPWHVVPADKKWFRNMAVARTIVDALESLKLRYPAPPAGIEKIVIE